MPKLRQYVVHTMQGRQIVRSAENMIDLYRLSNQYQDVIAYVEDEIEYKNRTGEDL